MPPISPATQGVGSNYTNPGIEPPEHGLGRSRGGLTSKVHQLVEGHGLPLATIVSPGQANDAPVLVPLVEQVSVPRLGSGMARTRPDELLGDNAYSSKAIRKYLRDRSITATIAEPDDQARHRKNRGSRGGRPPKFNAQSYTRRNIVERGFNHLKQWRGIATRYDKLATTYRAAALLHGVIAWNKHLSDTL